MRRPGRSAALRGLAAAIALGCGLAVPAPAARAAPPAPGGLDVGRYHACALVEQVGVRCWGYGADGALGYANTATIGDDETPAAAGPVDLGMGRTAVGFARSRWTSPSTARA